ncbi:MAG: SURF1 family protein [Marinobacterium sp.]|nr:SURF1 family protein [Marinobacterium sp.]
MAALHQQDDRTPAPGADDALSKDRSGTLFKVVLTNLMIWLQAVLIIALLLALGFWQLERHNQKSLLQLQWQQSDRVRPFGSEGLQRFDRVELNARFDPQRWLLLDNRVREGVAGYEVIGLTLATEQHLATGQQPALLVSLGWVAAGDDRSQLPEVALPPGQLALSGRLDRPEPGLQLAEDRWHGRWPWRIQQLDLTAIEAALGQPVSPWLLRPDIELLSGQPSDWQPVVMPAKRHLGYAVQWFALAFVWLLLTFWLAHVVKTDKEKLPTDLN